MSIKNAARALVLALLWGTHNMARSLSQLDANLSLIRQHYKGPITVADDLMCVTP